MRSVLELLDNVRVASPCSANWDEMSGDDCSRFCSHCDKHVYNLSALSPEAMVRLIEEKEGNLCGRFYRRADGTILTADCPVGVHHRIGRRRRLALLGSSLAALLSFTGCTKLDDTPAPTTANPPATQEMPPSSNAQQAPVNKNNCVMGKLMMPGDFRAIREHDESGPEEIPPPREAGESP